MCGPAPSKYGVQNLVQLLQLYAASETRWIHQEPVRERDCTTCHSAQGASIDGQIIIHAWEKKHLVTREWIWCALTRGTDFNKVRFFKSVASQNELNKETLAKYITTKVINYQRQDENAARVIDVGKYVNHEWFMKRLTNTCCNCGCRFEFEMKSKTEIKRVT